ncbi:hypothetical protein K438DRAFT_2087041 [Mycena galopus ATCC 62051]|nr:hypothetical protein K438DRAFT_2087041 [Mycena galopus ATCC 62051]
MALTNALPIDLRPALYAQFDCYLLRNGGSAVDPEHDRYRGIGRKRPDIVTDVAATPRRSRRSFPRSLALHRYQIRVPSASKQCLAVASASRVFRCVFPPPEFRPQARISHNIDPRAVPPSVGGVPAIVLVHLRLPRPRRRLIAIPSRHARRAVYQGRWNEAGGVAAGGVEPVSRHFVCARGWGYDSGRWGGKEDGGRDARTGDRGGRTQRGRGDAPDSRRVPVGGCSESGLGTGRRAEVAYRHVGDALFPPTREPRGGTSRAQETLRVERCSRSSLTNPVSPLASRPAVSRSIGPRPALTHAAAIRDVAPSRTSARESDS